MAVNGTESPLSRFELTGGTSLQLFGTSIVERGPQHHELIPLATLSSVRVEYAREMHLLRWGVLLLVAALVVYGAAGLLSDITTYASAEMSSRLRGDAGARTQGVVAALSFVFDLLHFVATLLPGVALGLALWAGWLLWVGSRGSTRFTLTFSATERVYRIPGRSEALFEFADIVGRVVGKLRP